MASARMGTYFVPGAGIDREVITTDICRYLGPDALVKPGVYKDPKRGPGAQPEPGYFVTAYRSLTTKDILITDGQDQLTDIKADSTRWIAERTKVPQFTRQNGGDGYRSSATRARQQDQPYSPISQPYGQPTQPQAPMQPQYDQYNRLLPQLPQQPPYGQPSYQQDGGGYTYGPPVSFRIDNGQNQQGRPPQPPYGQPPLPGYPPQGGRGMDTGYGGLQDTRNQGYPGAYDGGLGRSQPMAQQPNYSATSGNQSIDPYAYQRGPQQDDTAMDGYENYEDAYNEQAPAPAPAPAPIAPTQQSSRHRDRETQRDRESEPRRSDKHRRR